MSVKELKDFRSIKVAELILCQEAAEIVNSYYKEYTNRCVDGKFNGIN
jgi:hypothetical protein